MKLRVKRRYWVLACSLMLIAVAAWVEPTGVVRGWLRGEEFYDGRPTNYWSRELARWEYSTISFCGLATAYYHRHRGPVVVDLDDSNFNAAIIADDIVTDPEAEQELIEGDRIIVHSGVQYSILASGSAIFDPLNSYTRIPGILDKVAGWFGVTLGPDEPPTLLTGDSQAEAVLRELLGDANETVRAHAQRGLDAIARGKAP